MKALLIAIVLIVAGIAGVGFYRGWFRLSTTGAGPNPSATITVDKNKIRADEDAAKKQVQRVGHKPPETTPGR